MIFKFSYIKHNKFGRKGTINNNIDKTGFIYIKGYENLYMINNEGIIISCSKISGNVVLKDRYLKYTTKENGYLQVHLAKNGKRKAYYIHRLVAKHFIPNPNNYTQVNHKDKNPSNNSVDNLEWCNNSYNVRYSNIPEKLKELRGDKLEITNVQTGEIIIAKSKREAANIIKGSDAGIIYAINNNSLYKRKYKIKIISYGKR